MGKVRNGIAGVSANTAPKRKKDGASFAKVSDTIDDEEMRLTHLLFGEATSELLDKLPLANKRTAEFTVQDGENDDFSEDFFVVDKGVTQTVPIDAVSAITSRKPAWVDNSHDNIPVSLTNRPRLKKLRIKENESTVSGVEFEKRLRGQFEKMHPKPAWADIDHFKDATISAQSGRDSDNEEDAILRQADGYIQQKSSILPVDILDITKMKDANQDAYSQCVIQATRFHPSGQLLFTAGFDKSLRLFQIDGKTNPKVQSVFFDNFPIHEANYTSDGRQIILGSRRSFFYSYDLESNQTQRISGLSGQNEKSLESFNVSPDGRFIAFMGKDGHILLANQQTKQFITRCKMNGDVRAICFSSDGQRMFSHGTEGTVYEWDLRHLKPMTAHHKFRDVGCLNGISMAVSDHYLATGSDSGVVNIYSRDQLKGSTPEPLKAIMNLTTPVQHVKFNNDQQLLGMSSRTKKDAFRLVHLPSMRVFQNWPTHQTPLHYVQTFDFSPKSGYLALGNDKGKVLLYTLNHYPTA